MSPLRDEILEQIYKVNEEMLTEYDAADAILAKVREALLSDEAVTAATSVVMQTDYPWASARSQAAITAAFDAITGGDK